MKVPEIEWEVIETTLREPGKFKKDSKGLINIVSQFYLEQPALAFCLSTMLETVSKVQGGTGALLTCSALVYKIIKSAIEASDLEEQLGKEGKEKKSEDEKK